MLPLVTPQDLSNRTEAAQSFLDAYARAAVPSVQLAPHHPEDLVAELHDHLLCYFDSALAAGEDPFTAAESAARSIGSIGRLRTNSLRRTSFGALQVAARPPLSVVGLMALDFLGAASRFALEARSNFDSQDDFVWYTLRASLQSIVWYAVAVLSLRLAWVCARRITVFPPSALRPALVTGFALLGLSLILGHPAGLLSMSLMDSAATTVSVTTWLGGWQMAAVVSAAWVLSVSLAWLRALLISPRLPTLHRS